MMTLYQLRKQFEEKKEVSKFIDDEIEACDLRLAQLEIRFTQAIDPRAIHELKGRIEEVCLILGKEAIGTYRVNYDPEKAKKEYELTLSRDGKKNGGIKQ